VTNCRGFREHDGSPQFQRRGASCVHQKKCSSSLSIRTERSDTVQRSVDPTGNRLSNKFCPGPNGGARRRSVSCITRLRVSQCTARMCPPVTSAFRRESILPNVRFWPKAVTRSSVGNSQRWPKLSGFAGPLTSAQHTLTASLRCNRAIKAPSRCPPNFASTGGPQRRSK